ncbi:hypothetical protein SESBI_22571 [Sesbania bispinosa]|nr:hypothetical protein SESBI_22571 [Sesbania bispinosa]
MGEQEVVTERVPHPHSSKLGLPPHAVVDDEKLVSGLSTILVASIEEARDRISQIEYVFCTQLYPHFQSSSKLADSKRRRIEELEREVDEGLALQKSLMDLLRSKESSLKASEESKKAAIAKLESCESETASLLGKIHDLEEQLRTKTRQVEEAELKRVENDDSHRKLVEQVELLSRELQAEKMKRNGLNDAYKRLKSQHIYLRQKVGLTEDNMLRQNKSLESEIDLAKHQSPITEPGLAFEDPNITIGACKTAKVMSEIPEEDFGGLENKTPDVFVATSATNEAKVKGLEDDKGASLSPPSSSFHGGPKCPSSTKLVSVSGTKRPASSWRQTRSHQSRAGPDPHDDFLDTPLENIRENLNKDLNKEGLPHPIQKDISMGSSDDETQDLNAKSSPQKKQSSVTVANKRSFKYIEPVRKKAERENLKGVECKQCRKFYDAVLPNAESNKQNFRCEHLDGVSRHRYRYVPPMTPEGFWNIGFESEI